MSRLEVLGVITFAMVACVSRCGGEELPPDYDKSARPHAEEFSRLVSNVGWSGVGFVGAPIEVRVGLYIESLGAIKESTMDFSLTMYFRQMWVDPRLAINKTHERILVAHEGDVIWSPDLYFLYEKKGHAHDLTVPNIVTTIQPDGKIFRSSRISITSACYMVLHRFPFDSQQCTLNVLSYSYTTKDMILVTNDELVELPEGLIIPSFVLQSVWTADDDLLHSATGNFSMINVHFEFQRQMQSFLLTVYIPSMLLVTVAWLSFCIDAQAAPARVSLGITTVLTITTMTSGIQESLPVVTYAKAIDIWLAACLFFVFMALLEYALANYLLILHRRRKEAIEALESLLKDQSTVRGSPPTTKHGLSEEQLSRYQAQYNEPLKGQSPANSSDEETQNPQVHPTVWTADRLDRLARYMYPVAFFFFNLVYWPFFIYMDGDAFH